MISPSPGSSEEEVKGNLPEMYLLPNFGVFILFIFCVNGYELPAYNNGGFGREQIEFVDLTIRTKRETVSKENLDDLASITSEKNAPIGKDGHDFFRSTVGNSDEYSTGEEYEDAYTVDPDRHMKSFNGTDIGITNTTEDTHMYYNSSFYPEVSGTWKEYWLDLTKDPESHTVLPGAHRKTATIYVTFDFPFYGHIVNNVTIATGGFLYMGDYLHPWLAATQYAAPLLADFDTMSNPNSSIRYKDNGTALTVQWDQVVIHNRTDLGSFTFQLILKNTGEVLFVYKDVPVNITDINDDKHPVRVGLSDAYIIEKTLFFVRRKIIFMYHKVDFKDNYFIGNGTLLYFTPLPTCLSLKTCSECVQGKETIGFQCIWCPLANRCSDGIDRKRQDWLIKGCDSNHLDTVEKCNEYEELMKNNSLTSTTTATTSTTTRTTTTTTLPTTEELLIVSEALAPQNNDWDRFPEKNFIDDHEEKKIPHSSSGSILGLIFFIGLLLTGVIWVIYAYYNPHTPSGQFLIKYRPSAIRFRRGEPQYTAAIHM